MKTVVVIGCSSNPYRTSFHIAQYIQEAGLTMVPVNPNEDEVLGEVCYDTIFDLPESVHVDVIDIFRNKRYTEKMVREIVEWSESSGQKPVIWTQLDVSTQAAKQLAEENGFDYVENRCLMVEHRKTGA
nr:CoA-binding protein [Rhodohalobacter sp. SW132]